MKYSVITISRQYGSGGREIGTQLAQRLGNTGLLIGGQVHVLLQILNRLSTIGDLPMPVIPQIFGNVSEQTITSLHIRFLLQILKYRLAFPVALGARATVPASSVLPAPQRARPLHTVI